MTHSPPRLRTVGRLAEETGASVPRIEYILRTRPHIRPSALAGHARLYDAEALAEIRYELNVIAARRAAKGGQS